MQRIAVSALLLVAACGSAAQQAQPDARPAGTCRHADGAGVEWVLPREDGPRLDAWCAAVGRAIVRAAPDGAAHVETGVPNAAGQVQLESDAPAAAAQDEAGVTPAAAMWVDSLLVVSWNVQVGGADVRRLVADLRAGRLTNGPVPHFALLLQEVFRGGSDVPIPPLGAVSAGRILAQPPSEARTSIDELARELDLHLIYVPSMRNGAGTAPPEDRGNAILSSLPLSDALALELPLERQRRVAVAGTVRGSSRSGGAWTLQLASVHLENRLTLDAGDIGALTGAAARARQMNWLLQALPAVGNAVLAGDLNTWTRGDDVVQLTLPHFPQTASWGGGPTHVSYIVFRERLDYIFARVPGGRMTAYSRASSAYGSDHFPVLAWVHPRPADRGTASLSGL